MGRGMGVSSILSGCLDAGPVLNQSHDDLLHHPPHEELDGQAGVDFGEVEAYAAPAFTSAMTLSRTQQPAPVLPLSGRSREVTVRSSRTPSLSNLWNQ